MKHLRKIGILIIAVIMAAAVAVGICVVYAVRNVNMTFLNYSDSQETSSSEMLAIKESVLEKVRGRVISSVGEEDVASCLDDGYFLESFEKVYPCTINITVQQRREVYSVFDGENYSTYDETGKFMRTAENGLNFFDGAPNLILEGTNGEEDIKEVAAVCAIFKSYSENSALRSALEKVTLSKSQTSIAVDSDKIVFGFWCGISIEIQDYTKYTSEKISKAYKYFKELSPEQKLKGRIYCLIDENGEFVTTYNANA